MAKALNIDSVDQGRLWKRIDMVLNKLDKESTSYSQSKQQHKEKTNEITKILKEALGKIKGFELYLRQESATLELSAESLEAAYLQGYNDSLKGIKI